MPFRSKAQMRWAFATKKVPASKWLEETKDPGALPEKKGKVKPKGKGKSKPKASARKKQGKRNPLAELERTY